MAKFNFSNFKESLNGSTKRAKNTQVKRSDSSRYSKGKRSAASDQNLGWRIAKYAFIGLLTFFVICVIAGGGLFAYYVSSVPKLTENKLQSTNSSRITMVMVVLLLTWDPKNVKVHQQMRFL